MTKVLPHLVAWYKGITTHFGPELKSALQTENHQPEGCVRQHQSHP
jgi:hypothetical protein